MIIPLIIYSEAAKQTNNNVNEVGPALLFFGVIGGCILLAVGIAELIIHFFM